MTSTPTRRSVIGALAAAPALALPVAARANLGADQQGSTSMNMHTSINAQVTKSSDAPWDAALQAYRDAVLKHDATVSVRSRCEKLYFAAREIEPTAPDSPPLDTSQPLAYIIAQSRTPEWMETWTSYERARADCRARNKVLRESLIGDAERISDEALEDRDHAIVAFAQVRSPTIGHVIQKVEVLVAEYGDLDGQPIAYLLADLRQLDGEARS